jgi:TatD DNase family protein
VAGWVDTHCHLYLMAEDTTAVIDRAVDAGVSWLVCPGIDLESTLRARAIAGRHPDRVRWSAGLHPHQASEWEAQRGRLTSMAIEADAIGECGLDYYRDLSPREQQRAAFAEQVALADELGKPIIIHVRDAFADAYDILERAGLDGRAVMHCWTGGPRWTKRFDELGVTFSFAGPITYDTADAVRRGAAEAPRDRTLVETDSPYLTPTPHRGEENRPEWVAFNGVALGEVWGIGADDVAELTAAHAAVVFDGSPRDDG